MVVSLNMIKPKLDRLTHPVMAMLDRDCLTLEEQSSMHAGCLLPVRERKGQDQACPASSPKVTNQINHCSCPGPCE